MPNEIFYEKYVKTCPIRGEIFVEGNKIAISRADSPFSKGG